MPYFLAAGSKSSGLRTAAVTVMTEPHESALPCNPGCLGRASASPQHRRPPQNPSAVPVLLGWESQPRAQCQGGCRGVAEPGHVLGSEGASSGSEASLMLPKRQLEFPEPAQHPQGKADSEQQPKNSCPGHTQSPERRGSEKEDGLQLSKEQPPALLSIHLPWVNCSLCCNTFT